ncbi:hypothetical protein FIBSPDRAFT_1048462 [Athelia psychrophila]|uniref:Uncharacterized protein n=1 Tax=Athelia psychrophila TaxID=1759441 RepID=A0A166DPQ3_9AGAM|nr:hypothetical protein FIBSPDRAFT_1048462 [Fibularhizoctonia sp. CBS 109695]
MFRVIQSLTSDRNRAARIDLEDIRELEFRAKASGEPAAEFGRVRQSQGLKDFALFASRALPLAFANVRLSLLFMAASFIFAHIGEIEELRGQK